MSIEKRMNFIKHTFKIEDYVRDKYKMELTDAGNYLKGTCNLGSHEKCQDEIEGRNFIVSPIKQIFYCFACKRGGDIISYVAEKENKSQSEALVILEKIHMDSR